MSFRAQAPKFFFEDMKEVSGADERLIKFCKDNAPEFVKRKVTETADWAEMKKRLIVNGENVCMAETGEILEGVRVQEYPDKFTVATA